jgi:AcrR family transcriptional regulator
MHRRAAQVDQTRERITEAALRLHTSIGPGNTSIAGVAAEAGVTRLTVYRHFPDLESLFDACSAHWAALHPRPDWHTWLTITGLEERARVALGEMYAWYGRHGAELVPIYRDIAAMPASRQAAIRKQQRDMAAAIVEGQWDDGPLGRRMRAVAGHLISLWTWRSLTVDQGLDEGDAVEVGVAFLRAVAGSGIERQSGH